MKCIFCESKNVEGRTILKDGCAFAFLTNIPIIPGHTLIAPLRCVRLFGELSSNEKKSLEELRGKICEALQRAFGATGFNFAWNEGESAGQSVPHVHLHVLPRKKGDTGITQYEPRKFLYRPGSREETPERELQAVARLITAALSTD